MGAGYRSSRLSLPALLATLLLGLLSGCATLDDGGGNTRTAEELFQQGSEALTGGYYETAIKDFESLSAQYPFSEHAPQVLLGLAYAHYQQDEPESAIAEANQFIKTYPRDPDIDYAYYIRGLAKFDRTRAFGDSIAGIDPAQRDPREARESFRYFAELLRRYPRSRYAADARQRLIYLRNYLARHELHVAEYYLARKAYVAAANRASHIIRHFPQTPAIAGSLAILSQAYRALGIDDLAADSDRVRQINGLMAAQKTSNEH